jgi:polynucleotide 5'-kinase involved in rRNA processing
VNPIDIFNEQIFHHAERISSYKFKKILLLGEPDSGKTTFALKLAKEISNKEPVTLVDTDIGQSIIGPPTTVGSADINEKGTNILELKPSRLYFVGDITPVKFMMPLIAGSFKLSSESSNCQIIDTSGLVSYPFGHLLKYHKVMALNPDLIVCFQKEKELTSLIRYFKPYFRLEIIPSPKELPRRSSIKREKIRKKRFADYFKKSVEVGLSLDKLSVYPSEHKIDRKNIGLTIGLNGSNGTLGIGLLSTVKGRHIKVITPVRENIRGIVIGNLMITKDGKALGRLR